MTERRRVHYSGRVQGVGFRYTAVSIARRHAVTGFVKNLSDGRVVLVAEGEGVVLDRFLSEIGSTMRGYVRQAIAETGQATGEFDCFGVQY